MTIALHTELHRTAFANAKSTAEARDAAVKSGLTPLEAEKVIYDAVKKANESHQPKIVPHTAGPFRVAHDQRYGEVVVGPVVVGGKFCGISPVLAKVYSGATESDGERIANAKLFAGAPAVLAAAVKCLAWDDDTKDEVDHDAAFEELRCAVSASRHVA